MTYTVHQLATLAGVSARTLRYYDRLGLLTPQAVAKNGYRHYGDQELIRLQQILFFRELEFPLNKIKSMLDHPQFDRVDAFRYQRGLLELKRKRLTKIIQSIDKTIKHMNEQEITQQDRDLYGSLSDHEIRAYKQEAQERWGESKAYQQSQERVAKMSKADIEKMKVDAEQFNQKLADAVEKGLSPESDVFQALVAQHFAGINRFYDCTEQIYRGLADMYIQDVRFASYYRKYHKDLPEKLAQGMIYFADKKSWA